MKNKRFSVGLPCIVVLACMVLFVGCSNEPQEVNIANWDALNGRGPAATSVSAQKTTNGTYVIITWGAAENAYDYELYIKEEGKKTIMRVYSYSGSSVIIPPQWSSKFNPDGSTTDNSDIDAWSARITIGSSGGGSLVAGKTYRFGIRASGPDSSSSIVWSSPIQL